jgi:hypothetical protein
VQRAFSARRFVITAAAVLVAQAPFAGSAAAQQAQPTLAAKVPATPASPLSKDEITALAHVEVAIGQARDSAQAHLAQAKNKTPAMQQTLRDKLQTDIAEILHHAGMTDVDFRRKTYLVSTNIEARKEFEAMVAQITGVPTPGVVAAVPAAPVVKVPAGAVGTHIGHVVNAFADTPNNQSLMAVAMSEAKTAAQHAALAARQPTNLDYMKTHAGHVLNAIDPTIVAQGPGLGYGLKRAALGIATHIDLAAKAPGASKNVIVHAQHVATSANNTADRCDQVIDVAQKIRNATSAADAAALVTQLVSLTNQLIAGADKNGDGKIDWTAGEGGLQQADEHMKLMLAGEGLGGDR